METDKKIKRISRTRIQRIKHTLFGTRKRTIITVVVIVLFIGFLWFLFGRKEAAPQYQTAQVTKGTIISTVTDSGNVSSANQAGVGSPTTGVITEMDVKDGDTVTAGQNLFKVKSTASAQEIAQAYASYESSISQANSAAQGQISAQATLEKDRQAVINASSAVTTMQNNLNVSQPNPATKQAYTQNDIDAINSALTSARETFNADQLKYQQYGSNIAAANASENAASLAYQATQDSVVTAPIDGTVSNISVQVGDQVTASSGNLTSELSSSSNSSSGGSAVLSIGGSSTPYIKVQASEVDVPNIHAGQQATITLDAYPGKTFVGTVSQVDTVGTTSSGVVTYNVFVNFTAPPANIMPGMSATVTIETARKDDVLMVPSAAVQTANGTSTVRVLKNGQISPVQVTTGISSDTDTEIDSGLSEGQTVVTGVSVIGGTGASNTSSPFGGTNRGFGGGFGGGGGVIFRGGGGGAPTGKGFGG